MFYVRLGRRLTMNDVNYGSQPKPGRPTHIAALVGHDREEPGAHGHPLSELMELAPGARQRLLGGILGIAPIPQHRQGQAQTGLDQRANQRLEGCLVAGNGPKSKWLVGRQAQSVCHTL